MSVSSYPANPSARATSAQEPRPCVGHVRGDGFCRVAIFLSRHREAMVDRSCSQNVPDSTISLDSVCQGQRRAYIRNRKTRSGLGDLLLTNLWRWKLRDCRVTAVKHRVCFSDGQGRH
jgi:hypothetical protein